MTRSPLPYSEKLLEYFRNPRNQGSLEDADVKASAGSPACGDMITFYLKVTGQIISKITFESYGCASNIATASYLTRFVEGKSLEESFFTPWKTIADDLGGLPPVKVHCGILAVGALRRAIREYFRKTGETPHWLPPDLTPDEVNSRKEKLLADLSWNGPVYTISAVSGEGTGKLVYALMDYLEGLIQDEEVEGDSDDEPWDPLKANK